MRPRGGKLVGAQRTGDWKGNWQLKGKRDAAGMMERIMVIFNF